MKRKKKNNTTSKKKQKKKTIHLEKINQKALAKAGRSERYRDWIIQTKQDILKQRKTFYQQVAGECTNTDQQPDDKETTILEENMGAK